MFLQNGNSCRKLKFFPFLFIVSFGIKLCSQISWYLSSVKSPLTRLQSAKPPKTIIPTPSTYEQHILVFCRSDQRSAVVKPIKIEELFLYTDHILQIRVHWGGGHFCPLASDFFLSFMERWFWISLH